MDIDRIDLYVTDVHALNEARDQLSVYFKSTYQPFMVSIYKKPPKHTRAQQNTFRGWCRIIGDWNGDDPQALHDFFCKKFLGTEIRKAFDKEEEVIIGTSGLGVKKMSDFMQQVEAWIAQNLPEIKLPQWEETDG